MIKKENAQNYLSQVQTDVGFTSFMVAAVIFFNGFLITRFDSYNILIKIPVSFLIVSTFGFLLACLILANTADEINKNNFKKAESHFFYGYIISEYIGVYLLILSIPLVINIVTSDLFLRILTISASSLGLIVYQFSHFSIVETHFKKSYNLISSIVILLGILLFLTSLIGKYYVLMAILTLSFLIYIAFLATRQSKRN
jgi:hypothetical protein